MYKPYSLTQYVQLSGAITKLIKVPTSQFRMSDMTLLPLYNPRWGGEGRIRKGDFISGELWKRQIVEQTPPNYSLCVSLIQRTSVTVTLVGIGKSECNINFSIQYSDKRWRLGCVNSPRGQREPGRGITQPSLRLLAEYCRGSVKMI